MTTKADPSETQPPDDPLALEKAERAQLTQQAIALYQAGMRGANLYTALEQYNYEYMLIPQLDQDFVDQVILDYLGKSTSALLEQAITDKDLQGIFMAVQELVELKAKADGSFSLVMQRIKQAFGKTLVLSELNAAMRLYENKIRQRPPDIADVAYEWSSRNRNVWAYHEERGRWYLFQDSHWQEQGEKCPGLDSQAITALQEAGLSVNSGNALSLFRRVAMIYCTRQFNQCRNCINFANGTLHLDSMQLSNYNREDNFTYCLPYCYNPYGSHPSITAFLEVTIPDEHGRQAYMAHLGLALMGDTALHRFLLLKGPPRSGKSILLALANLMCEMGNIDGAWSFAGDSLFSAELEGKRARFKWNNRRMVAIDELPADALIEEELVKAMAAHSGVEARGIGRDEEGNNRWRPKIIMTANDTPHYKDFSGAIKERAIFIACPNGPIPESQQDPNLFEETLAPEVGAFAATCLLYGLAALQRGSYPRSAAMKGLLHDIGTSGNPLKSFLQEKAQVGVALETKSKVSELYEAYRLYCTVNGYKQPLAANSFSHGLTDMYPGVVERGHLKYDGKSYRCLTNIRLRLDEDQEESDPHFEDDPFLIDPISHQVYDGYDGSTAQKTIVDQSDQPLEQSNGHRSTMATMVRSPITPLGKNKKSGQNEREEESSPNVADTSAKTSLPSLTDFLKQQQRPIRGVYDLQKHRRPIVDPVDQTQIQHNGNGHHHHHPKRDGEEKREEFRL